MRQCYLDQGTYAVAILQLHTGIATIDGEQVIEPHVYLTRLLTPSTSRHQGGATRVLTQVLQDADREGMAIYLSALASGRDQDPDDRALYAWYERHGFHHIHQDRAPGFMRRLPQ